MKSRHILPLLALSVIITPALGAEKENQALQETQEKIADAAKSVAQTTTQLADKAQSAFSLSFTEGKAESLLFFNKHLNGYDLDVEIKDAVATLKGVVSQEIEKDLAQELVLGIQGIDQVKNRIQVMAKTQKNTAGSAANSLGVKVKDAAITARIKTKLLANSNVSGMKVNVDTSQRLVTLRGEAQSLIQRDLIEQIAANTDGVKRVLNQIEISEINE